MIRQAAFPMPDRIAEAGLQANIRYPQTATGLTIMIGEAATSTILEGTLSWEQLRQAELTQQHITALSEAVGKMHAAYKIPDKLRSPNEPPAPKTFTAERFKKLTGSAIDAVHTATANFALLTLSGNPRRTTLSPSEMVKDEKWSAVENVVIDELYRRTSPEAGFRPEAIALGCLWKSAAASLSSEPAKRVGKTYRDALSHYITNGSDPAAEKQLDTTLLESTFMLKAIIGVEIAQHTPVIAEITGVDIETGVIQTFLRDTVHGIVSPADRARHLAASASNTK